MRLPGRPSAMIDGHHREKFISENLLGIEVEVEFQPLYAGQPLFSDVDSYVRNHLGLQIQDLGKYYWKYPEGINVGSTQGQLIFGDALYLRPPHNILTWCSRFSQAEASRKIQMACVLGVIYGYLDYSLCILNQASITDFLELDVVTRWKYLLLKHGRSLYCKGRVAGRLSDFFFCLYKMFKPTHQGWASTEHQLGSRKQYGIFK
ncbi:MAG: hypothetical protein HQL31_09170 [Planctomycetes bacterium]|nr:hypothetical protein [Planctomycetota bacterium]